MKLFRIISTVCFMLLVFFVNRVLAEVTSIRKLESGEEIVTLCGTIDKIAGEKVTVIQEDTSVENSVVSTRGFKKGDKVRFKIIISQNGAPVFHLIKGCTD